MGTQMQMFAAQHRAAVGRYSARAVYQAVVTANMMRRELEQLTCAVDAWDEWRKGRDAAREARRPWLLVEWMTDAVVEARLAVASRAGEIPTLSALETRDRVLDGHERADQALELRPVRGGRAS